MLLVGRALFQLVFLNKFVTLCMGGLWYVEVTHFFVFCVFESVDFFLCFKYYFVL